MFFFLNPIDAFVDPYEATNVALNIVQLQHPLDINVTLKQNMVLADFP